VQLEELTQAVWPFGRAINRIFNQPPGAVAITGKVVADGQVVSIGTDWSEADGPEYVFVDAETVAMRVQAGTPTPHDDASDPTRHGETELSRWWAGDDRNAMYRPRPDPPPASTTTEAANKSQRARLRRDLRWCVRRVGMVGRVGTRPNPRLPARPRG